MSDADDDPTSATAATRRGDCNCDTMQPFVAAHDQASWSSCVGRKIDLHFWLTAVCSECDHGRQSRRPTGVESPPAIRVPLQHGGVLLRRERSLLVKTLAFVVCEFCRKLCCDARRERSRDTLRCRTIGLFGGWSGTTYLTNGYGDNTAGPRNPRDV
jgi:hypothetical protein